MFKTSNFTVEESYSSDHNQEQVILKMSYSIRELLRVPLSTNIDDNGNVLWTKIGEFKRGTRTAKRKANNTQQPFAFHALEIRLYVNGKKTSGISLSAKDFEWLVNRLRSKDRLNDSYDNGRQLLHFSRMNTGEKVLSTIDDQKVFSVLLNSDDEEKLLRHEEHFKLLLNHNDNNKGIELYNLVKEIFVSFFGNEIENTLAKTCTECSTAPTDQKPHTDHAFMFIGDVKGKLLDKVLDDIYLWNEFSNKLENFLDIMNVGETEKLFIRNERITTLKANKEAMMTEIGHYLERTSTVSDSLTNLLTFIQIHKLIY